MFETFNRQIDRIVERLRQQPVFQWAVVTSVSPLQIQYDGATDPVAGSPDTLEGELMVGDRVFCIRIFRRDIVIRRAKGGMRRFTLKSQLDAWAAPDGTVAYVTSENRHYVRSGGMWLTVGQAPYAMAVGFVGAGPLEPAADEQITVTFPVGRFTVPPRVQSTPMGGANLRDVNATVVSATVSSVVIRKGSNSPVARSFGFTWQAVQMSAGSADG